MIINFKIFEEYGEIKEKSKVFWVVDHDENFEVSLFKIGMSIATIEKFKAHLIKNMDDGAKHYYFGYDPEVKKEGIVQRVWSYDDYNYVSGANSFVDSFYKYMGHVEVDDNDKWMYEISKKGYVTKYNL